MRHLSSRKLEVLLVVLTAFALSTPATALALHYTGTISSANTLPNGRPNNDSLGCFDLTTSGTFYYTTVQFTVPVSAAYHYTDGRYTDGTIDTYIGIYTGTFDPANPLGGGCIANFDDFGTINLTAGVHYTMMLSSWASGITGPGAAYLRTRGTAVTVDTSPTSLGITVDGTSYTAPQTFLWSSGSSHAIATTSPQQPSAGTKYVFQSWSDGGAVSHSITTPNSATLYTYTASFQTQYYLTTAVNPSGQGSISPASGYFDAGSSVNVTAASAGSGLTFTGFSGDLTGATNPQTLLMDGPKSVTANFAFVTAIPALDWLGIAALAALLALLGLVAVRRGGA